MASPCLGSCNDVPIQRVDEERLDVNYDTKGPFAVFDMGKVIMKNNKFFVENIRIMKAKAVKSEKSTLLRYTLESPVGDYLFELNTQCW